METHNLCPLTHSLLAAGNCTFCDNPIVNGEIAPDAKAAVSEVAQWNTSAVLAALAQDGETPSNTVTILSCHEGNLFEELPIWRVVLDRRGKYLRGTLEEMELTHRARRFHAADAERCERHLLAHPDEFALRIALVGYYFLRSHEFPAERAARQRHCLWIIEHRPGSHIAGTPFCILMPEEEEAYQRAKRLWLRNASSASVSAKVLGNAARFFTFGEEDQSERFYQRAQELEPENPEWPVALGQLYSLRNVQLNPEDRAPNATRALSQFERALRLNREELDRGITLIHIAKAAFDAGDYPRAHSAAEELLRMESTEQNPADLLHAAHITLGRLALKEGNIGEAKRRLACAAEAVATKDCVHAPGPRELWLAQELLERGEKTAVIEYLHQCSPVWQDPWHSAEIWASAIERGEMPDFRHHVE